MENIIESRIIGLMSGSSLDGLDIAYCHLKADETFEHFGVKLLAAETVRYPSDWVRRLAHLDRATALEYAQTDVDLGHFFGQKVAEFRSRHEGEVNAIASHGHTVFHQPQHQLTTQIGDGDAIAAETGLPVVYNFRRLDVALGGQGAPLVPIGDQLLFRRYDGCLNLGGFANISYDSESERRAYDVAPCNVVLNYLARQQGGMYDRDGLMARRGEVDEELLERLESMPYYQLEPPKTLGKEWVGREFIPNLSEYIESKSFERVYNAMRTTVEHIALRLADAVERSGVHTLLVTGGGAKNRFLVDRLRELLPECEIEIPSPSMIDFKEAIIFAFLGFLRLNGVDNTLRSVTGASFDSCGGNIAGLVSME